MINMVISEQGLVDLFGIINFLGNCLQADSFFTRWLRAGSFFTKYSQADSFFTRRSRAGSPFTRCIIAFVFIQSTSVVALASYLMTASSRLLNLVNSSHSILCRKDLLDIAFCAPKILSPGVKKTLSTIYKTA